MAGRADKGIIVTTGSFTAEARREATRDGAPPIELIDGEKLSDMLEKYELGLKPVTTYEVEHVFFKQFEARSVRKHSRQQAALRAHLVSAGYVAALDVERTRRATESVADWPLRGTVSAVLAPAPWHEESGQARMTRGG